MDEQEAYKLLQGGEYGILSLVKEDGCAYGIPVNYVWDGADSIYLHVAPEGEKLRCIAHRPEVSFCVVGRTKVIPDQFTTGYESIVVACRAQTGLPAGERMHALELLLKKYAPDDLAVGMKYAEKSFHRTEIIRLNLIKFSGKCKRVR